MAPNQDSDFTFVMAVAWIFLNINLFGSGFVLYNTYLEWRYKGKNALSLRHRLPFYNALTNLILYIVFGINIFHSVIKSNIWPYPTCQSIGFANVFVMCLNIFLIAVVSIIAYLQTCKRISFELGRNDYKLFFIVIFLALAATLPGYFYDAYGENVFWCANKQENHRWSYISICVLIGVLVVTLSSYINLLVKLPYSEGGVTEDEISRSITGYMLVGIFQWVLLIAYYISNLTNEQQLLNFIVMGITINISGIGGAIHYGINKKHKEAKKPRRKSHRLSATSSQGSASRTNKRASKTLSIGSALEVVYEEPIGMGTISSQGETEEII